MTYHTAGTTAASSLFQLHVTAIILLQLHDRCVQCVEPCHDGVERGLSGRLSEVELIKPDEDINYNTRTSTSAAPEAFQAPPTPLGAPPLQAQAPSPTLGPITRARARELNYIMLLKNEGPEE
jgi:hypothetical protein